MVLSIHLLSRVHLAIVKNRVSRDDNSVTRLHFALVNFFWTAVNCHDIS